MTQSPFDQLAKQYLEEFLAPIGTIERQYEVPGEAKFVDVWFVPLQNTTTQPEALGILGRIGQTKCLLEPFRNAPTRSEIRACLLKLIWIQEDERRSATQIGRIREAELPQLWILAATVSQSVIQAFKGEEIEDWQAGVYFLGEGLKTAIVAIDELPETEETLWLGILGRGATQERAIRAVLALPPTHPRRNGILRLLASWKVRIDMTGVEFTEQEALMALSEAFLAWEQATQQRAEAQGQRSLILLLLNQKLGVLPSQTVDRISALGLQQLERLAIALLNFSAIEDLTQWLDNHQS